MYPIVLSLHNLVRWVVVILAVAATVRAFIGWLGKKEWTALDNRLGVLFSSSVDVQLLLGLLLYFFLSPITGAALKNFGAAMSNPELRFFAVEHVIVMFAAAILAHVGRTLSKKAAEAASKHRLAAIFFGLAILAIAFAIPWSRPLIRLG
ncbi:MAG: putative rane protein [Chloroflexi bacterium]|jgi:hypothetical protein|nr:putative rane protein [Chloroflexota bacterium]